MGTRISKERLDAVLETKYGDLQPIEYLGERFVYGSKRHFYKCLCICGKEIELNYNKLQTGNNVSCGCTAPAKISKRMTTHGLSGEPEFNVWVSMRARCYTETSQDYGTYGAQGIRVQQSWLDSFENFYVDMGPRPSSKHTIERLDPYKDYCKENCIWTDDTNRQAFNRKLRVNSVSGRTGVSKLQSGRFTATICYKYTSHYLGSFDTYEEAVSAREKAELKYFGFIKEE